MMKAFHIVELNQPLELREVPLPVPGLHEVLIKLKFSGVCHTDVHIRKGDLGKIDTPLIAGHEGVGEVVKLGRDVKTLKVGDHVGIAWLAESCLNCSFCEKECENLCPYQKQSGFKRNGTFAEYVVGREEFLAKIPIELNLAQATPVLCAGVTVYKALKLSNTKPGDFIVISGAGGGVGHMCMYFAKIRDLKIIALDKYTADKYNIIKRYNPELIVDISELGSKTITEFIEQNLGKNTIIAASIVTAPTVDAYYDAIEYTSSGGAIVAVSLPKEKLELDIQKLALKELRLQGTIVGTPKDLQEAVSLMAQNQMIPSITIKTLGDANEVMDRLDAGDYAGRVVLDLTL